MPYTPPSQQSPVASKPSSPNISRTHSHSRSTPALSSNGARPSLPRSSSSTSYLHKHRRSPSLPSTSIATNDTFSSEKPQDASIIGLFKDHGSLRQSPPPMSDAAMPPGALISPPDSPPNYSDDEENQDRGRTRKLENLAELQAAISAIEQKREGSPSKMQAEVEQAKKILGLKIPDAEKSTGEVLQLTPPNEYSREGRKVSHSRSITESAIVDFDRPKTESPNRSSDSDLEDEERIQKPPMLRKKSGELVRPALRPAYAKRRPSSMPGTPTYSKAVHFDSHLEHVRHFLSVDRPLAVSANSSPVDSYEGETEFPFGSSGNRQPPWQWDIKLPNFPRETLLRKQQPIHVEKVFLSADGKTLIGSVAVQNLAFHKQVIARFTLDHWKTTSEVGAEYTNDMRRPDDGLDRFNFNIRLEDLANIENRTLFFCVRYSVNGQDFWDSNGDVNFQVNFEKKPVPQNGKNGMKSNASKPLTSLPRSRPPPPQSAGSKPRPKSASSFDDFAHGLESFPPPFQNFSDTPLRFRNKKPSENEPSLPTLKKKAPSQAFGNRYDFGASLTAAMQSATSVFGEDSGIQLKPTKYVPEEKPAVTHQEFATPAKEEKPKVQIQAPTTDAPKLVALTEDKPDMKSQSYSELLDKYCFFGSAKTSPQQSQPENGQLDGTDDAVSEYYLSRSGSAKNSPVMTPQEKAASQATSPLTSRSASPGIVFGSRAASPSFGYPYHHVMQHGMFAESQTPTAIRG